MKESEKDGAGGGGEAVSNPESPPPSKTPFERFEEFARRVVSVPRAEIEERERAYREQRARTNEK